MIDIDKLFEEWLKTKKTEIKPLSYDKYETIINIYLIPFLHEHPIETLDIDIISQYLSVQHDKGLSQSTLKIIKYLLKSIYSYAGSNYSLKHIDFSLINISIKKKEILILDEYQEKMLYEYCCNHVDSLGVMIVLCLYAGLKSTEICALKYSDIDIDNGTINVSKKVQRQINRNSTSTKTVFSTVELVSPEKRIVALSQFVLFYLKLYMSVDNPDYDCYLLNKSYKVPEQRNFQIKIKKLSQALGFEINFNILRNKCKENCIKNNVDLNTLLHTLGMPSITITADDTMPVDVIYNQQEMNKIVP